MVQDMSNNRIWKVWRVGKAHDVMIGIGHCARAAVEEIYQGADSIEFMGGDVIEGFGQFRIDNEFDVRIMVQK